MGAAATAAAQLPANGREERSEEGCTVGAAPAPAAQLPADGSEAVGRRAAAAAEWWTTCWCAARRRRRCAASAATAVVEAGGRAAHWRADPASSASIAVDVRYIMGLMAYQCT